MTGHGCPPQDPILVVRWWWRPPSKRGGASTTDSQYRFGCLCCNRPSSTCVKFLAVFSDTSLAFLTHLWVSAFSWLPSLQRCKTRSAAGCRCCHMAHSASNPNVHKLRYWADWRCTEPNQLVPVPLLPQMGPQGVLCVGRGLPVHWAEPSSLPQLACSYGPYGAPLTSAP